MAKEAFSSLQIVQAIQAADGLIGLAAQNLGCSAQTVRNYSKRYPECAGAVTDARQLLGDLAENRLARAINEGEPWAIRFYLESQHRDRGYGAKVDRDLVKPSGRPAPPSNSPISS